MAREYISAPCKGLTAGDNTIILSLYGPRGGSRACEELSLEQARNLAQMLNKAIEKLEA